MVRKHLHPKWYVCAGLVLAGLVALFLLRGYQTSGLVFLGLAALIPVYHGLGLLRRHKPNLGRVATMLLSLLLGLMVIAMAVTCGIILESSRGTQDPDSAYLVVLGAKVNGTVPSRSLKERMDAALGYLAEHPDAVAVVSGGRGKGESITEAQCMFDYLTGAGIDPKRVWMEDQATNTLENLRYSLDLVQSETGERPAEIAIVSSEYHLHRAGMFARQLEIEPELIPAETGILPLRWNYYLREIFAVWYYTLFTALQP